MCAAKPSPLKDECGCGCCFWDTTGGDDDNEDAEHGRSTGNILRPAAAEGDNTPLAWSGDSSPTRHTGSFSFAAVLLLVPSLPLSPNVVPVLSVLL